MFYLDDSRSGPTASEWGVFMGTSHHEPMARADKEQSRFLQGRWDWGSNKAGVQTFMKEGAQRSKGWLTMYTLGMRGSGDAASPTLTSAALEDVIKWQQSTLAQALGKDLASIPQQWVMYKEVPGYWQNGMKVSDDITLLWSDDNRGNIRRIPIANETTRRGGSGSKQLQRFLITSSGDSGEQPRRVSWFRFVPSPCQLSFRMANTDSYTS